MSACFSQPTARRPSQCVALHNPPQPSTTLCSGVRRAARAALPALHPGTASLPAGSAAGCMTRAWTLQHAPLAVRRAVRAVLPVQRPGTSSLPACSAARCAARVWTLQLTSVGMRWGRRSACTMGS